MRKIHFADELEKNIALALDHKGIEYIHESENQNQTLDFYLPKHDVYIEIKKYHSDRISNQMASKENVIAVQGRNAVNFLEQIII